MKKTTMIGMTNRFFAALRMTIILFVVSYTVMSCNESKGENSNVKNSAKQFGVITLRDGTIEMKIPAVYINPDSTKNLGVVLRQVRDRVHFDSTTGKKSIVSDTLYAVWGDGIIKGISGKDSIIGKWHIKGKDSVRTDIENKTVEELFGKW